MNVNEDVSAIVLALALSVVAIHKKLGRPAGRRSSSTLDGKAEEPIPKAKVYQVCSAFFDDRGPALIAVWHVCQMLCIL